MAILWQSLQTFLETKNVGKHTPLEGGGPWPNASKSVKCPKIYIHFWSLVTFGESIVGLRGAVGHFCFSITMSAFCQTCADNSPNKRSFMGPGGVDRGPDS